MSSENILKRDDCLDLLKKHKTPPNVVRHCFAVSNAAVNIAKALNKAGFSFDAQLVFRAALLHDIARVEKNHEKAGADIVRPYDPAAAEIIGKHMHRELPARLSDITEGDIVSIADRSVFEDEFIGAKMRMGMLIDRFSDSPEAVKRLEEILSETLNLIDSIEKTTGENFNDIASGGIVNIDTLLHHIERPGRYIGGEIGSVTKDIDTVKTRFCFAFPDLYEIGMSYTGFQTIYGLLNSIEDVYCERCFAPAVDMEKQLREKELPLFTLETHSALNKMDFVGFTLQYELSYSNIVNMLELSGIPVFSKDRGDNYPLICAGGPCACNPEPLADIFDFFCIGDAEEILPGLMELYSEWDKSGRKGGKEAFLVEAAEQGGVYVPRFYYPTYKRDIFTGFNKKREDIPTKVKMRTVPDFEKAYFPEKPVIPHVEAVHERAVCELFRGCSRGCRFCQAGFIYRPVRRRSVERVKEIISAQIENTGYDEVSLLSLSTGDYPGIEELVIDLSDELIKQDVSLSLPSLRLDSVPVATLSKLAGYKKSSLTFAPEAGTQRLRDAIRKNISDEDILKGVEKAISIGWDRLKLYFMIGFPGETIEDIDGIVILAKKIIDSARAMQEKGKRNFSLTVSVSNFIPKPHTPLQWLKGAEEEELLEKAMYLKNKLHKIKGVSFRFHDTRQSAIEMQISKGDRRIANVIVEAVKRGCRFDSWREFFDYSLWQEAFSAAGLKMDNSRYTETNMELPWDVIGYNVEREFLLREFKDYETIMSEDAASSPEK